jgi:hypothetical protein
VIWSAVGSDRHAARTSSWSVFDSRLAVGRRRHKDTGRGVPDIGRFVAGSVNEGPGVSRAASMTVRSCSFVPTGFGALGVAKASRGQ